MRKIRDELTYPMCLEAAGITVHEYESFGSYQGDWWAKVTLPDGQEGWVRGCYGSCSGCDALEAAFDYGFGHRGKDATGRFIEFTDDEWDTVVDFGRGEAGDFYTQRDAEREVLKRIEWDMSAKDVVTFIRSHAWGGVLE